MTSSTTIPAADYHRIIRGQIEHEDNLITNRLSWLIASQSFLFTAYAILTNGITPGAASDSRRILLLLIPAVASVTCLLILLAILGGIIAMSNLRSLYQTHVTQKSDDPLPPIQGCGVTRVLGLIAPVVLPIMFLTVWGYLLMRRLV